MRTITGNLYDYPKYYDLVFGSDWQAEVKFLVGCFERYATGRVKKVFEPGCGTGRLMYRLAKRGYRVAGNDLCEPAVDYCNRRLVRGGFPASAVVGDMSDFTVRGTYDAAMNTINTFRHLSSHAAALGHLRCVARVLRSGGIYVLGLHLTPTRGEPVVDEEHWAARRGNLSVLSRLWSMGIDRRRRVEEVGMSYDVYTPTDCFRLVNRADFRTYTMRQMADLIAEAGQWTVVATHDFAYQIDSPTEVDTRTEDVVYVLRKT